MRRPVLRMPPRPSGGQRRNGHHNPSQKDSVLSTETAAHRRARPQIQMIIRCLQRRRDTIEALGGLSAPRACMEETRNTACPAHRTRSAEHLRSHRRRTSIAAKKWLRQPGSTAPTTHTMPPIPPAQTLRSKRPLREIATPTKRPADRPTRRIHAITSGGSSPPKPAQQHDPQTKTPP